MNHAATPPIIIRLVADYAGVTPQRLISRDRHRPLVDFRNIAMYLCRTQLGASYPTIGKWFERDHTTIIANIRSIETNREPHILRHLAAINTNIGELTVDQRAHTVSVGTGIVLA